MKNKDYEGVTIMSLFMYHRKHISSTIQIKKKFLVDYEST